MDAAHESQSPAPTAGRDRTIWMALACLVVLAAILRIGGLGQQSLWVDEAFSYQYAKPDEPLRAADFFDNLHGPLHALVLHYWMKLAGHSEVAVRLPSVLASLGSLVAFWFYARRAWSLRVAWAGALLLAVAPFHIWYAQECRNYAFLILFAVLAEWAFHRLTTEPPRATLCVGYGLALLGGFLSNLSMAFFVFQHGVRFFLLARPMAPQLRTRMVVTWLVVGACLAPWAINFYEHQIRPSHLLTTEAVPDEERLREDTTATPLGIPYTFYTFATGYSFGPAPREFWQMEPLAAARLNAMRIVLAAVVFGALWVIGLSAVWRTDRRRLWHLLAWQLLPLLALMFIALRNVKVVNPRYVATMYPAFVLTLALGAWRGRGTRAIYLLALGISLLSFGRGHVMEKYHKEDYRSAAHYLLNELKPGDAFVSLAVDLPMRNYYMRTELRGGKPIAWEDLGRLVRWKGTIALRGRGLGSYEQELLPAWRSGRRLFVFLAREWVSDPDGLIERDLRSRGVLVTERSWTGTRVLVLERTASGPGPEVLPGDAQAARTTSVDSDLAAIGTLR
jgi:mannosyltransferase